MSLLCVWRQRKLAEAAARRETLTANPGLREHLKQCASCRHFWKDLRDLTGELSALEEALPAGDRFADAVWDRLTAPATRTQRVPAWLPTAAIATCAVVGFIVWRVSPLRQNENVAVQTTIPTQQLVVKPSTPLQPTPEKRPRIVSNERPPSPSEGYERPGEGPGVRSHPVQNAERRVQSYSTPYTLPKKRLAIRRYWKPERRYAERKKRIPVQEKPKRVVAAISQPPTPEQWKAWGAYYEAQGDYQRASAAYGQAYVARPDTETALAAGQAAESAGDVAQALTYYTQILNRPTGKKPPEKETRLWRQEDTSA